MLRVIAILHLPSPSSRYDNALHAFQTSLNLSSGVSASALAGVGFTKHLLGDLDSAIESYHRALSLRPDDVFVTEMLRHAVEEAGEMYFS